MMLRKKYVPDLSRQMADCEANYLRLCKLMPDFDERDSYLFEVTWKQHRVRVRIEVEERFAYTSTLTLEQQVCDTEWLQMPVLVVRLYHDARMAEVICRKQRRQLKGFYPYPNDQMHHPDEKAQLNRYLAEWLAHCLAHGHSADRLAIA
ncbi:DUF1249 domain-containing protein [Motiliproteus sediminis]|uniref:DUF1249 domain-containing protein n=1 Tax=Motiliproteus sediminis TaxID=1468178 RepID=UPI0031B9DAEE